ncbi:MAG: triose-phosphate isomerase [Gammaproteobacteria bacterium]|nr:triose-phosphate isomerase [Gammaproteobacteria bacterium]
MRNRLIVGNWKMHGSMATAVDLIMELEQGMESVPENIDVAVAPPFLHIGEVIRRSSNTRLLMAAQNVSAFEVGAVTGEVSSTMLADIGIRFVIVGHSERRSLFGESNETVAEKFARAYFSDLTPILCVGETQEQREAGFTEDVVLEQMYAIIDRIGIKPLLNAVVAYEPVWAIGTGASASPEQAQEVHALLRSKLASESEGQTVATRLIYGGSVKASNSAALFGQADIDGALVGGASLDAKEFLTICKHAGK